MSETIPPFTKKEKIAIAIIIPAILLFSWLVAIPMLGVIFEVNKESDPFYTKEIVKVNEVKTVVQLDNGFVRYYFKSNSSITPEWIPACSTTGLIGRKWFVVSINDTLELLWRNHGAAYIFHSAKIIKVLK